MCGSMAISATCGSGGVCPLETALLPDLLIDILHARADGVGRGALQTHIESGVNARGVRLKIGVLEFVLQLLADEIHVVRRFGGLRRAARNGHGRVAGQSVVAIGDIAVGAHQPEHDVAAVFQPVGMAIGIEREGR